MRDKTNNPNPDTKSMKHQILAAITALSVVVSLQAQEAKKSAGEKPAAEGKHGEHEKHATKAGPNGGRMISNISPHAEFFVTKERKVQITFVGEDGKPTAPTDQTVTVTAGDRSKPTKLTFVKSGTTLLSEQTLPEGNDFPTVVQIRNGPTARPVLVKFNLNTSKCPTCEFAEYACTCEHGDEDHEDKHEKKK